MNCNKKEKATKSLWSLVLAEGIFAVILGGLIIMLPNISTFALAALLSVGLILLGIYKLINSIILRKEISNSWLSMFIAILMIFAGIYLTINPFFNILILTMAIGIFFILDSINTTVLGIQRKQVYKYWWITFISSLIQLLLALIIIFGLPYTALWTIGILIGVNIMFGGFSLISLYFGTKDIRIEEK